MPVCPACGEDNPERARYCLACGSSLALEVRTGREVRKTVSIVFCDVTGSTSLGERLDPESLRRVMTRYFDEMRAALERHGGTVEKFIGDAVMAVFGIPSVHEDDALRAVRAAHDMRSALADLNKELERDRGVTIASRIGVNTGPVVAGDPDAGQALVTGDAVNIAARLEQAAQPGEVLIGEETWRLVRDAVETKATEPLTLKGKAGPIAAFRLLDVSAGAAGVARRLDAPMIGRDQELGLLGQAFERATSERACNLFTVLGTAGVGKSRLLEEFLLHVRDAATVIRGRCLSYGEGITLWPLAEAVSAGAGVTALDPPDAVREGLVAVVGEDRRTIGLLEQVLGIASADAAPEELARAIRVFLERLASEQPLVVVFDDVHWGEPTFLDVVEHVADRARDVPILLVCQARPELLDVRAGWGGGKLNATTILLEPLPEAQAELLVEVLLGETDLASSDRARIAQAAGGMPLYVEQMLGMLIDEGRLARRDGRWVATANLSDVEVPPTVQALIAARLDLLTSDERDVLERGSVIGQVFYEDAVVQLSDDRPRTQIGRLLDALTRKDLVRPDRDELGQQDSFRFRHLLVRDAAYDAMPKQLRGALHERFASWLEARAREGSVEMDEFVGYHLEQAYRYRAELGPPGDAERALAERAAEYLASSGERALNRGDPGAAGRLLERTLALIPRDHGSLLHIGPLLGHARFDAGDYAGAREILQRTIDLAERAGDRGAGAYARSILALVRMGTDRYPIPDAIVDTRTAIHVLEDLEDVGKLAELWANLGALLFWSGRAGAGLEAATKALDEAVRTGTDRAIVTACLVHIGILIWGPTPATEGIARADALLRLAADRDLQVPFLHEVVAALAAMLGDEQLARERAEIARRAARDLGLALHENAAHSLMLSGQLLGDLEEVVAQARSSVEFLQGIGEHGFLSTSAAHLAETLLLLGRTDEALEAVAVAQANAEPSDAVAMIDWMRLRAACLAALGRDLDEAERLARDAVASADGTDYLPSQADAYSNLAQVLRAAGRRDEARAAFGEAIRRYETKENLVWAARMRRAVEEL